MNKLQQLRSMTTVVADTGDIESIKQYTPTDATTNPSLIYKAAQMPQYQHLLKDGINYGLGQGKNEQHKAELTLDKIAVNFGKEILKIIPGRVSTEVDARLSFDTEATIERAHQIIDLYRQEDVPTTRILIKIASTWEGIRAAEQLEKQGIHCNLTLMFNKAQAIASAEADATLISPFVGRIFDWHKKKDGVDGYVPSKDPGVQSVTDIYNYYKKFGYNTTVMGASFRNKEEIMHLAGCDLLTISPSLMEELQNHEGELERRLDPGKARQLDIEPIEMNEAVFRWMLNDDPMATEKLAEGIRGFAADTTKLEKYLQNITEIKVA